MKYLIAAAALMALGGEAQAQITNCWRTGTGYYCVGGGGGGVPAYSGPSPAQAFVNGMIEGREWRLRMEREQLENELLRRRLNDE